MKNTTTGKVWKTSDSSDPLTPRGIAAKQKPAHAGKACGYFPANLTVGILRYTCLYRFKTKAVYSVYRETTKTFTGLCVTSDCITFDKITAEELQRLLHESPTTSNL